MLNRQDADGAPEDERASPSSLGRLLFLFPHEISPEEGLVASGRSPTERLYGAYELRQRGWSVRFSDSRFAGRTGRYLRWLRRFGVNGLGPGTVRDIAECDVVLVKDEFSAPLTVAAKLLGKRLVFLDSMFRLPRRTWRRAGTRLSLALADCAIGYSTSQIAVWRASFPRVTSRLVALPYCIDTSFYVPYAPASGVHPPRAVLAIGRDLGRDFPTLISAIRGTDITLHLVTLPYLLRGLDLSGVDVRVHAQLDYQELFEVYRRCGAAAIPLRGGTHYPSGIRALLEAMALKCPFVATRNDVIEEYVEDGVHGCLVPPADAGALRAAIEETLVRRTGVLNRIEASALLLRRRYDVSRFADLLEGILLTGRGEKEPPGPEW